MISLRANGKEFHWRGTIFIPFSRTFLLPLHLEEVFALGALNYKPSGIQLMLNECEMTSCLNVLCLKCV